MNSLAKTWDHHAPSRAWHILCQLKQTLYQGNEEMQVGGENIILYFII